MKNIYTSELDYKKVFLAKDFTRLVVDAKNNDTLHIIYSSDKPLRFEIVVKKNLAFKAFFYCKRIDRIFESIIVKDKASFKKYKINFLNNSNLKYDQKIYLRKKAYFEAESVAYAREKLKEINQIEIFHTKSESKGFQNSKNIIVDGYIETNCISNVLKKASDCIVNQSLKSILLTKNARSWNRPILNIKNRNVEAKHACAVGKVSEEQVYYLQNRGFSQEQARKIICYGFFSNILQNCKNEEIKSELEKNIIYEQF